MKGLMQLLANASSTVKWYHHPVKSKVWPAKLTRTEISLGDQQMMNPQQTISDVMAAFRPAAFVTELLLGFD